MEKPFPTEAAKHATFACRTGQRNGQIQKLNKAKPVPNQHGGDKNA